MNKKLYPARLALLMITIVVMASMLHKTMANVPPPPITIGDFVWNDLNGNGIQDAGEPGIEGVIVVLNGTDADGNAVSQTTVTDTSGKYSFTEPPGTYLVAVATPTGYIPTATGKGTPATDSNPSPSGTTPEVLPAGGSDQTLDFGFYNPSPGITLTKSANPAIISPYQSVTYTYVVRNTGNIPINNIVVTDDNGTPNYLSDDFTVGTIALLGAGESATLTATVIPVVSTVAVVNGTVVNAGAVIVVVPLENGDIKTTYLQNFDINDNTYGTGAIGWHNGHKFTDLVNSDRLEFRFYDKNGTVVLDFYVDCVSQAASVTVPGTGQVITYPSGYGTLGAFGREGCMVSGDPNNIVSFSTSISDNLNQEANLPYKSSLMVNSPTALVNGKVVVDPAKAPGGWDHINSYTVVVKASTFGSAGFGAVSVPDQHNSPSKLGVNQIITTPEDSSVVNTAKATDGNLTVTATASVNIQIQAASSLPSPWNTQDIGTVQAAGSANYTDPIFTIEGSGNDIGGSKDEFRYLYQTGDGDCSIVAKVLSVEKTDNAAKAGIMIRESLTPNSAFAAVLVTPANGIEFKTRNKTGAAVVTKTKAGLTAPYWTKVVRSGNVFTGYYSPDGSTWTSIGSVTINMGSGVYVGLAVNSHKDGTLCTGTFNNVTVIP